MKKILMILLCGILVFGMTGCGSDTSEKDESKKGNTKNEEVIDNNKNDKADKENNEKEVINDTMTLENFKRVMKEHGLNVVGNGCDESTINCLYTAYDDREGRRTAYEFTVYRDEESATRFWKSNLKNLRDSFNVAVKDEKNRKLEYSYGKSGIRTLIYFYSKTTSIHVDNDDSDNKDSLNYVKEILAEFGYADGSGTSVNKTNKVEDVIKTKDYTIKYGTYKGVFTNAGYTLTDEITITKDNMKLSTDTCEYVIKDNIIHCKQADAIKIIVIGNNKFTDASNAFIYTLSEQ